eukprot:CAMPEP_0185168602 /NCGR_PEP_ID=MMETSP1139-20130426/16082_1 /TAXON_ID=298111 /ORGANISM="Pavlova sp., Strain CCMP459" /LENGTH=44 /DNA_ID= /DNA_START= /DNA_END= /DNA_ORIENTATION=
MSPASSKKPAPKKDGVEAVGSGAAVLLPAPLCSGGDGASKEADH